MCLWLLDCLSGLGGWESFPLHFHCLLAGVLCTCTSVYMYMYMYQVQSSCIYFNTVYYDGHLNDYYCPCIVLALLC